MKWSIELVKNKTKELDKEYICLSNEYINNKEKLKFKHLKCNNTFMMPWNDFNNHNYRCPYCKIKNRKKTTSQFDKEVKEKFGNDYKVISEYTTNDKYVTILHEKCNTTFQLKPCKINFRKGCPICNKTDYTKRSYNPLKTTDTFKKEVYELVGEEYDVLSEYKNCHDKILIRHNKCKNEFKIEPNNFIRGQRCPYCSNSRGEQKINKWLNDNSINFEKQKTFKYCKDKNVLPFDFYLEDYNICIEYDGIQHFKKSWFDDDESFELRKYHDDIKTNYCKKNKIKLLRINYKDFDNIEKILKEYLSL